MRQSGRDNLGSAGLTLIEVVLALGLMGLILSALLAVSSSGLGAWLDTREALADIRREANWTDQLRSSLAAMVPLTVANTPPSGGQSVFFLGRPRAMHFVSAHSPVFRGRGGVRLVSLRAASNGQKHALELTDTPCPDLQQLGQILAGPMPHLRPAESVRVRPHQQGHAVPTVVAEDVTACSFQYLYSPARAGEEPRWVSHWSAPSAIPQAVRVEWTVGQEGDSAIAVLGDTVVLAASVVAAAAPIELYSGPRQSGSRSNVFD